MYRVRSVIDVNSLDRSNQSKDDIISNNNIFNVFQSNIPNRNSIVSFQNVNTNNTDELCLQKNYYNKDTKILSPPQDLQHQTASLYLNSQENHIVCNNGDPRIFTSDLGQQHRHMMLNTSNNNTTNNNVTISTSDNNTSHGGVIIENSNMIPITSSATTKFLQTKTLKAPSLSRVTTAASAEVKLGKSGNNNNAIISNNNNSGSELESLNETTMNQEYSLPPPPPQQSKRINKVQEDKITDQYLLWIVTPVAASISLVVVLAALAGPQWLYTEEKLPNTNYNGTANFNVQDDGAFITKYTKSSLWILCSTLQGFDSYHCIKIDYFPKEEYRPDHHDSTLAIPYTVVRSSLFFLISGIFLLLSFIVFLIAICTHQNHIYYFTSGILYIITGLLMFIGLIVYISIFKAEIGSKLRPKSTLQPPLFKYSYGQSFFLYVFGFILTEFVGVLIIFLFISLQQVNRYKKIPCFTFINAGKDKVKIAIENRSEFDQNGFHSKFNSINGFMCRKHSVPANYFSENYRYYFEKFPYQQQQHCGIHNSQHLAKSLNELYVEPSAPNYSSFDLPSYSHHEFPPLTRSVSTSTEIFSKSRHNNTVSINNSQQQHQKYQQSSSTEKKNKKNQTMIDDNDDYDEDFKDENNLNNICGLSRGILSKGKKSKDELFYEFCKKAGMRPKPKNIYYINGGDDDDDDDDNDNDENNLQDNDSNIFIIDNSDVYRKSRQNLFREPSRNKKNNSTSSLRITDKVNRKNLFDLEQQHQQHFGSQEIWNNDNMCQYFSTKNENRDINGSGLLYQSRTLPRCFLKRNFDSDDPFLVQNGFSNIYNNSSRETLHKSFDNINFMKTPSATQHHFQTSSNLYNQLPRKTSNNNLSIIQWPAAIPTSPSSYSIKSSTLRYNNTTNINHNNGNRNMNSNNCGSNNNINIAPNNNKNNNNHDYHPTSSSTPIPKFTRGFAFDDRRSDSTFDSFNLDEIERERRKSHASLLGLSGSTSTTTTDYDMINGTAV